MTFFYHIGYVIIASLIWKALVLIVIGSIFQNWFWNCFQIQLLIIEFQWFFQPKIQLHAIKIHDSIRWWYSQTWTRTAKLWIVTNLSWLRSNLRLNSTSLRKSSTFCILFFVMTTFDFAQKYNLRSFCQFWFEIHLTKINFKNAFLPH